MVTESLVSSVGAGFGLIRREFGSVLVWGLIAFVLNLLLPMLVGLAFMGPAMFAVAGGDAPDFGMMMAGQSLQSMFSLVGAILTASIVTPAIYRAVLRPRSERGFAWLRFGATEAYMGLFHVIMAVIFIGAVFVIFIVLGIAIGIPLAALSAGMTDPGAVGAFAGLVLLAIPLALILLLLLLYPFGRLWIGSAMIAAEDRLVVFDSWALTKGLGWRLVGMQVVIGLIMIGLVIVLMVVVLAAIAAAGISIGAFVDQPQAAIGGVAAVIGAAILGLVGYFVFLSMLQAIGIAPWARAYQIIARATGRVEASVFS